VEIQPIIDRDITNAFRKNPYEYQKELSPMNLGVSGGNSLQRAINYPFTESVTPYPQEVNVFATQKDID